MINQPKLEIGEKGLVRGKLPESGLVVIFGASGDLAHRELIPALSALRAHKLVSEPWAVIGFDLKEYNDVSFRAEMELAEKKYGTFDDQSWAEFASHLYYVQGDFSNEQSFQKLANRIQEVRKQEDIPDNLLFHLATPQRFYQTIIEGLKRTGLSFEKLSNNGSNQINVYPGLNDPTAKELREDIKAVSGWRRAIIEKPFGDDEDSAKTLDKNIHNALAEEQIYRVDHFLGKETVQNMLVFRFANPGYEPIWNRNFIESVHITAAEDIGIGTRGSFYEKTGVIKDMFQNHLLQLLCITAIEPPVNYDADSLRSETVKVLKSINPLEKENFVLGQYSSGEISGEKVRGYRDEDNVAKDSMVPTYVSCKLNIDNWRWTGVPFFLTTGKRLNKTFAEVKIKFKATPHLMFPGEYKQKGNRNILSFQLQPNEAIIYTFLAKQPGGDLCLRPVTMNFNYAESFAVKKSPSAYQWLIWDAMKGDQTLFPRSDWIYHAWKLVDPIIKLWGQEPWLKFPNYAAGTDGPTA